MEARGACQVWSPQPKAGAYEKLRDLYLANFFADELAEIEGLQGDIDALSAAVQLVWTKLYGASGMPEQAFKDFWKTLELASEQK